MSHDMTDKFRIFRRASGVWYIEDKETRHQQSLCTRDATEAKRLLLGVTFTCPGTLTGCVFGQAVRSRFC